MKNLYKMALLVLNFSALFLFLIFIKAPCTITAAAPSKVSANKDALPDVKLNVKSAEIVKGKTYTLKVYNTTNDYTISYKSNNTSVASVSSKGLITGKGIGNAQITVTVKNGTKLVASLTCEITVGVPAIYVRFTTTEIILTAGQTTTLKYLIAPYNTVENPRFTALNSEVVSISTGGRIAAKKPGVTSCYALIDNGISRCKVIVISEKTNTALKEKGFEDLSTVTMEDLKKIDPDTYSEVSTPTPIPGIEAGNPLIK